MAGYIGPVNAGITSQAQSKRVFAPTTTTTVFSFAHDALSLQVFHNGVRLVKDTDYTANGTAVTLTSAAENGDQVVLISNPSFQVADTYTQAEADGRFLTPTGDGSQLTGVSSSVATLTDATVAATDPPLTANPTSGVGHLWLNSTSGEAFICTDATSNANTWTNTGDGSGSVLPFIATGGTKTTSGDFTYHTFTSSGTFAVTSGSRNIDYLVVAGGGSGGNTEDFGATGGGGGGAGGYIAVAGHAMSGASSNAVVVGAGGAAQTSHANGNNGSTSSFLTTSTVGGGGGGGGQGQNQAPSGGSGGGGCNTGGTGGAGTSGQGFAGGAGTTSDDGGGGGGASEAGQSFGGSPNHGGGDGKTWLDGTTYAGGGAGGSVSTNSGGSGGGGSSTAGSGTGGNGTVNTGGGGAAVGPVDNATSGAGGSGVVIIRYLTAT